MTSVSGESHTTQSSARQRRPGAAKTRLAKAKEAEKRHSFHKNGWHESIQAAAVSADRVWEPKIGWFGYKDQQKEVETFLEMSDPALATEKIHIPLHVAALASVDRKGSNVNTLSTSVAEKGGMQQKKETTFPVSREQQHNSMSTGKTSTRTATTGGRKANAPIESKPSMLTKASTKTTTRQSLVHSNSKPKLLKAKDKPGLISSTDPCWPPSPKRTGTATTPLLRDSSVSVDQKLGHGSPSRRRPKGKDYRTGKKKTAIPAPENPPLPPKIERRLSQSRPSGDHQKRMVQSLSPSARQTQSHSTAYRSPPSPMRAGRWVESMRRATSKLAEGHTWDPKSGFANLDDADVVSLSLQPSIHSHSTSVEKGRSGELKSQAKSGSPAHVLEMMIAERRRHDPPGRKNVVHATLPPSTTASPYEEEGQTTSVSQHETHHTVAVVPEEAQSTVQEQIEVVRVPSDALTKGELRESIGISALNFEEDEDYLLRAPVVVTPNVAVKKEKVSRDEFGLFPKARSSSLQHYVRQGSLDSQIVVQNEKSKVAPAQSRSGRSSGPIDVDEVENLSGFSSETSGPTNVWDSTMFENDSFLQGSIQQIYRSAQDQKKQNVQRPVPIFPEQSAAKHDRKPLSREKAKNPTSQYSSLREIISRQKQKITNDPKTKANHVEVNTKTIAKSAASSANTPGMLKTNERPSPEEVATDGAWKSFLNKKVIKESSAQQKEGEVRKVDITTSNDEKIKKTVSFAEDSLLGDSLLDAPESLVDSLFDGISTSDVPGSPKINRWAETRVRLAASQHRQRIRSNIEELQAANGHRLEEKKEEAMRDRDVEASYGAPLELPPQRLQDRSFGDLTDVSPLTYPNTEEKESLAQHEVQPSFLQRLAECRAPALHQTHLGSAPSDKGHFAADGDESPMAYQWYQQSRQASQKVEEMMEFLRLKRLSSCSTSNTRHEGSKTKHSPRIVDLNKLGQEATGSEMNEVERAAHDLARARVEAMVETLYYAS